MINGFIKVLLFLLLGEVVSFLLPVSIPGAVIGMVLLFLWLAIRDDEDTELVGFTTLLLRHLSLLFIPASVGIMVHLDYLTREWLAILGAVLISTLASIIVTAFIAKGVKPHSGADTSESSGR